MNGINKVFDDVLKSLHVRGSVLLREAYSPPWAITVPAAGKLSTLLEVDKGANVIAFHLVEFGHCEIESEGGERVLLKAGQMLVCFGGEAHRISQGKPSRAQSIETLLAGGRNVQRPSATGLSSETSLLCGVFLLHHTAFSPLVSALPRLLHTTLSRTGALHNLSGAARLMAEEIDRKSLGGGYIVERLLEVLCAEAIRAHIETASHHETSWFRGVKDSIISRTIAAIHMHPGKDWSVEKLARIVAMSPSRFAARFSESLGDSPMAYVAKWRMNVACSQLLTSRMGIGQVAANVGYESQAAFNRAFKKHVGLPPAAWRTRERTDIDT